ncbi:MAG: hypothetical protein RIS51_483 [Actinomycetota bacterium]|jgi:hypothetical protein
MSKVSRKAWAAIAGAALGASSLIALPAQAAPYKLGLSPTEGTNWAVFGDDSFSIDVSLPTLVGRQVTNDRFALAITNSDSTDLDVEFQFADDTDSITVDKFYLDADGNQNGDDTDDSQIDDNVEWDLDFDETATKVIFSDFDDTTDADDTKSHVPESFSINLEDFNFGDGQHTLQVVAWLDSDGDLETVDADSASTTYTITFYDPDDVRTVVKIERAIGSLGNYLNVAGNNRLWASVKFSKVVNLAQVNLADNWNFDMYSEGDDDGDVAWTEDTYLGVEDPDDAGALLIGFSVAGIDAGTLADDSNYYVESNHNSGAAGDFKSNTWSVVDSPTADNDGAAIVVDEGANALEVNATTTELRTGTKTSVFVIAALDGADYEKTANIPVVVRVEAIEGTASVAGVAGTAAEGTALVWNTLTNAEGRVYVVITSSAAEGDSFAVDAFMIDSAGTVDDVNAITATYSDAETTDMSVSSSVLSGAALTLSVDVVDQFGEPISKDDTNGKALMVRVSAEDSDDLIQRKAVVNGTATFTFNNWLAAGESDNLEVHAYTGAADDSDNTNGLDDSDVTVYGLITVAGVTVTDDELDAEVNYLEFSGAAALAGDDPLFYDDTVTDDTAIITGTVIDAAGAGVPGAAIAVSGAGLQFEDEAGNFKVGSMSTNATEAGTFTIKVWTHTAADVDVTITSGGKSTKVTIAGALDDDTISAANLKLSWNLPSALVYNTTYAVVATVADVWGNPIPGADVTFAGEAAAQFNSDTEIEKTTNASGKATAYLRSLEDVSGLAAVSLTLADNIDVDGDGNDEVTDVGDSFDDTATTGWDESDATDTIETSVNFLTSAPVGVAGAKVNAGSFRGYVAIYAAGYKGKRLSAKVGKDWVVIPSLASDFVRVVEYTGAGYTINVPIYIDGVLLKTIAVTTK